MDFCAGHPNNQEYHYHFHAHGSYEGCPNSCSQDAVSDIIGVALDGFAIKRAPPTPESSIFDQRHVQVRSLGTF